MQLFLYQPLAIIRKKINIQKVIIKNLYGYLNKKIEFNDDINLLVGINGSGKTSVLNVINWMLVPSFSNLCVNEYDKIELWFSFKGDDYKIISKQNDKEVTIDLSNLTTNHHFPQIQADFKIHPREITKNTKLKEDLTIDYRNLTPEKHEQETWNFLFSTMPNPIVIGLDRNLFTEEGDDVAYLEDNKGLIRKRISKINKKSPLDKVMSLSGFEYMNYKNNILDLNKRLNDKIMLSSFDETLTDESLSELLSSPKISLKQVNSLEIKVKEYFKENVIGNNPRNTPRKKQLQDDAFNKIEKYFTNLKAVLKQVETKKNEGLNILYITNLNQFRKIKELIKEFEDFETKTKRFYKSLKEYLDTINLFLKDSAKELYFDKKTSKLKFRILNKENQIIENDRE